MTTDAPNHPRPVTDPRRYGYVPFHGEQQPCIGCGHTVTFDADRECWWVRNETGNPPPATFTCAGRVGARHLGSLPRVAPGFAAHDPLLRVIAGLVSYMDLHIGAYELRQLTTEQKELWADLVDTSGVLDALDDPDDLGPDEVPRRTPRWWREDYTGPTSPDDPRFHSLDRNEPDPFTG